MEDVIGFANLNLYQGVRGIAVKILNRVDRTDAYLDKLLEIELKNSELSGPDKALLFELVHGVTRWQNKIDWILNGFYKGQFSKCIPNVKNAMRVALYQVLFLDKIPDYAAVNEAVDFVKRLQGQKPADLTNAVLRNIIRSKNAIRYPDPEEDLVGYFSAFYSHPSWLIKRWLNRYGSEFTKELLIANNNKPTLSIRVNNLKTTKDKMKSLLDSVDLGYSDGLFLPEFLKLNKLTNIADWEYFAKGYFSIQDESTGLPCKLLGVNPGMRVLDMCAAPGGKTGLLTDYMENQGELIAIDRYESRIKLLKKNLDRLGVENVKLLNVDVMDFNEGNFDRILIDVPCTGLGTLTKKPDIKWKRDIGDISKLNKIQYELLEKGSVLLKKGGFLVYSTCSIEPEENFYIVRKFLEEHPDFSLVNAGDSMPLELIDDNNCIQSFPHIHSIDGSFAAKIMREK